jgi:hypothetical protein
VEYSCGWGSCPISQAATAVSKKKIEVKAGAPGAGLDIDPAEINAERKGALNKLGSLFSSSDKKALLEVTIVPSKSIAAHHRYHMQLLPTTYLVNRPLLAFVSGFRNAAGAILLKQTQIRKPDGDCMMSCFPKIMDNIDIIENLVAVYNEGFWATKKIGEIMEKVREIITRLYPVIYSTDFKWSETGFSDSACSDPALFEKRKAMIAAALKTNAPGGRSNPAGATETLTDGFKPFGIRELEVEVWDAKEAANYRLI